MIDRMKLIIISLVASCFSVNHSIAASTVCDAKLLIKWSENTLDNELEEITDFWRALLTESSVIIHEHNLPILDSDFSHPAYGAIVINVDGDCREAMEILYKFSGPIFLSDSFSPEWITGIRYLPGPLTDHSRELKYVYP